MNSRLIDSGCTTLISLIASKPCYLFLTSLLLCALVASASANNIAVNTNVPDIANGDGKCSLIEAINEAQAPGSSYGDCPTGSDGPDTITLEVEGPYSLTSVNNESDGPNGLPSVTTEITINGNGAIVERRPPTPDVPFRIFHVGPAGTLRLNDLSVERGIDPVCYYDYYVCFGGGIYNTGKLTLSNSRLSHNGGGIGNTVTGTVEITDSALVSTGPDAIDNAGVVYMTRTTVNYNAGDGCGALHNSGDMTIQDSAIYLNEQFVCPSGIVSHGETSRLVVVNTTVTNNNNSPGFDDGGISVGRGGFAEIINSTIADNNIAYDNERPVQIAQWGSTGTVILRNTIVYSSKPGNNCSGNIISMGHNVSNDYSCNLTAPGDQPNTDPLLGDLADNGGPTLTRALLPGSPAIDAGESNCTDAEGAPLLTDQRSMPRPADGNSDGYTACDIGAYEVRPVTKAISIDIKPGTNQNRLNPRSRGKFNVAILTSETFDAGTVDVSTAQFGPGNAKPITHRLDDVDHDGDWDLVLMVKTQDTKIACGDTEATLTAQTFDGVTISDTDSIKTVGCKPKKDHGKNDKKH